MGACSRKSREMGLIHITTTSTGARKLTWSRTLRRRHQAQPRPRLLPLPAPLTLCHHSRTRGVPAPMPPPHTAVSPNWARGLSAAIRRASRCVWARRSPGKVRQAPRKEQRATSPSLKASLARGSLQKNKGRRGNGLTPIPQSCGGSSVLWVTEGQSTVFKAISKNKPPFPILKSTHVQSHPRGFRMLSRLLLTLSSPVGSTQPSVDAQGRPPHPGSPHPPGSRPNSR